MSIKAAPTPPCRVALAALILLAALCLGIVATSQTLWIGG